MSDANMEVRMRSVEDTLARIETKLDASLADVKDHECRLRKIEGKSGNRWEALVGQIVGLIAAGAIGMLLGQFIK